MLCYQYSLYQDQYFTPDTDRIIWQTSGDILNGSECFNRPDLLTAARAETAPHLCLADARTPHKKHRPLDILNSTLNNIILLFFMSHNLDEFVAFTGLECIWFHFLCLATVCDTKTLAYF